MPPKAADKQQASDEVQDKKSNLENVKYQCTACEEYIKSSFDAYVHPLLKCLICRKCHTEYKTGDFAEDFTDGVDSEGIDNYCRWCVDGGDLFACSNQDKQTDQCTHVFCDKCISRNVPEDPVLLADVQPEGFKWLCYVCNPAPLKELRKQASEAILLLSQRDLKRQKESVPANSQGQTPTQKGDNRVETSNGAAATPSRKNSETTSPSRSPVAASKKDDKVATSSSNKSVDKNPDESVSERKRRRTEAPPGSSSTPVASEPERRESLTRKEKDKKKEEEAARDPESLRLPPLEKPKQAQTSLRNLSRTSIQPGFRQQTVPPGTVSRNSMTPQSSSASKHSPSPSSCNSIVRSAIPTSAKVGFIPHGPSSRNTTQQPSTAQSIDIPSTLASTNAAAVSITSNTTVTPTSTISVVPAIASVTTNAIAKPKPSNVTKVTENFKVTGRACAPPSNVSGIEPKLKVTGKGLKPNNDQKHASTKVRLSERELKERLANFGKIKDKCIMELDSKVQNICQMFMRPRPEHKSVIKQEIDDLRGPLQDFQTLMVNLESLYSSQS